MKWADAKTRLSFVTATLNSLWAATPPSFQQHHVDGGAGQVRGGAGVQRVGLVPELSVEGGDRVPTRRRAHAAGVHHGTGAPLHRDRRFRAELAGDVGIGRRREERQIDLDDRLPPGEPVGQCAVEPGRPDRECRLEIARVLAGDRITVAREHHGVAQGGRRRRSDVLLAHPTQARRSHGSDRDAYVAIRSVAPAGLGRVSEQDVAAPPTATLRDAMVLARDRDAIAREYASDFETTFAIGAPGLHGALSDGLAWREAVVEVYLALLAASPDTHIARKLGAEAAVTVQRRARAVVDAGGVRTTAGRDAIAALDRELRDEANTLNPGATADLTGAAIYVVLLEGGWRGRP